MLFLLKRVLILSALLPSWAFGSPCDLMRNLPLQIPFRLSDGSLVLTPTVTKKFDSFAISGFLNFAKTTAFLKKDGVQPQNIGGRAFGVLSVYNYKDSDMGSFQEAYFVILSSPPTPRIREASIFHVKVWSTSPQGALASKEIWGIPSHLSKIEISGGNSFKVVATEGPVFEMHFGPGKTFYKSSNQKLSVNAIGPFINDKQKISPIKACRQISASAFSTANGDRLLVHDLELQKLFSNLSFRPLIKEIGRDQQAIQFLPK